MWWNIIVQCMLWILLPTCGHLPDYASTPSVRPFSMWASLDIRPDTNTFHQKIINFIDAAKGSATVSYCYVTNKIDQFCSLAESCIHDTIPICGKMGDETRGFLDLCDLLEYACDTNIIFTHVEDIPGCPKHREE